MFRRRDLVAEHEHAYDLGLEVGYEEDQAQAELIRKYQQREQAQRATAAQAGAPAYGKDASRHQTAAVPPLPSRPSLLANWKPIGAAAGGPISGAAVRAPVSGAAVPGAAPHTAQDLYALLDRLQGFDPAALPEADAAHQAIQPSLAKPQGLTGPAAASEPPASPTVQLLLPHEDSQMPAAAGTQRSPAGQAHRPARESTASPEQPPQMPPVQTASKPVKPWEEYTKQGKKGAATKPPPPAAGSVFASRGKPSSSQAPALTQGSPGARAASRTNALLDRLQLDSAPPPAASSQASRSRRPTKSIADSSPSAGSKRRRGRDTAALASQPDWLKAPRPRNLQAGGLMAAAGMALPATGPNSPTPVRLQPSQLQVQQGPRVSVPVGIQHQLPLAASPAANDAASTSPSPKRGKTSGGLSAVINKALDEAEQEELRQLGETPPKGFARLRAHAQAAGAAIKTMLVPNPAAIEAHAQPAIDQHNQNQWTNQPANQSAIQAANDYPPVNHPQSVRHTGTVDLLFPMPPPAATPVAKLRGSAGTGTTVGQPHTELATPAVAAAGGGYGGRFLGAVPPSTTKPGAATAVKPGLSTLLQAAPTPRPVAPHSVQQTPGSTRSTPARTPAHQPLKMLLEPPASSGRPGSARGQDVLAVLESQRSHRKAFLQSVAQHAQVHSTGPHSASQARTGGSSRGRGASSSSGGGLAGQLKRLQAALTARCEQLANDAGAQQGEVLHMTVESYSWEAHLAKCSCTCPQLPGKRVHVYVDAKGPHGIDFERGCRFTVHQPWREVAMSDTSAGGPATAAGSVLLLAYCVTKG